ncbi:MAG TPA: Stp1/IreP family PP2C-type Ser/Thr phosphatase [Nitrospirota bacterium]|nr:Stp1/IreP family PP2C-type Ser/Thr phosphatase [Nitrospirota bacterium]
MEHGLLECLKKITKRRVQEVVTMPHLTSGNGHQIGLTLQATKKSSNATRMPQPVHTLRLSTPLCEPVSLDASDQSTIPQSTAWYGITDRGRVREHNEDNFAILELADKVLFVLADGMGGHDAGEVASRIATETVCNVVKENHVTSTDYPRLVERAVQAANIEVLREGVRRRSDLGTTLSVALVVNDIVYAANVGDSRIYWIENGSISQITKDHSLVAKLVEAGKLTKEEARNHPQSNLLIRTVGNDETIKADTFRVSLKKGGTLLLCTDGLWGDVTDDEIHRVCTLEENARAAGDRLVEMAKEHSGKDNITVVVVKAL